MSCGKKTANFTAVLQSTVINALPALSLLTVSERGVLIDC